MSKSIRVSEAFHGYIKSQNRDSETMEDTLRRLVDAPSPIVTTRHVLSDAD
ncbi:MULTISPECIES: hypothetical protein [Haloferax]|uniref:Uncharacterized protein n=1 Tax=Haloferax marinum TaxID=2666143 RepID=A0A6A8G9N0_9EURY|nr:MULTISPECIES: hypothetical protein [Haloferax]MRW97308.1 hypothetical protein [Haloferax marinum]